MTRAKDDFCPARIRLDTRPVRTHEQPGSGRPSRGITSQSRYTLFWPSDCPNSPDHLKGLEARTPFLDRDLIDFAQSIPASLKMKVVDEQTCETTEKWILRKACEDLLPENVVWHKKAQFDEGSGTVEALDEALSASIAETSPVDRAGEGRLYENLLRRQYVEPDFILENAGMWTADRVAV